MVARLLGAKGRVLPMASVPLDIAAEVIGLEPDKPDEVSEIRGQARVAKTPGEVCSVRLIPQDPPACPESIEVVLEADWVVLGPGSWFTSVIPHLLVPKLADAVRNQPDFWIKRLTEHQARLQELVEHLQTLGKKTVAEPARKGDPASDEELRLYFMCDRCDHDSASPYRKFLLEKGIEVDWLPASAEPGTTGGSASFHREWLLEDHGFVIYYGNSGYEWYKRQRQELRKAKGYGRTTAVRSLTFLDPPSSQDKDELRVTPSILDGLPPKPLAEKLKELDAFVDELKRNGGGGTPPS